MPFNCVFKMGRNPWFQYAKVQPLGEGAQGTVWECKRIVDGARVAIKTIKAEHRGRYKARTIPALKRMVELSNDVLANISGPLEVYDNYTDLWSVQRLGEMTLTTYMKERGPWLKVLPNKVKSYHKILRGIMNGVDGLHSIDVAHRDLKPDNIIITVHGPKLTDWGHVKATNNSYRADQSVRNSCIQMMKERLLPGIISGDPLLPACISPYDSDQYEVGCLIMRLCIGDRAYKLLWDAFLNKCGNYDNAVIGFENKKRCIQLLRDELDGREEWTLVVKYLSYMLIGVNCKGNEFHEMTLWAKENKAQEKKYVNTIGGDNIIIKLLIQIEKIGKNAVHDFEAYNVKKLMNGYVSHKLKNVCDYTIREIKTNWSPKSSNEQKEDNHREIMFQYLIPNCLDLEQLNRMEDVVEDEIEKLINDLEKLSIDAPNAPDNNTNINENANTINGYTIVRGAKFTAEQQRHNPMSGISDKYECKGCGAVGKHWIQNCPMIND